MKTQRRHELHTNVLADRLAQTIETVRPYGRLIGALVVVAAALILALGYGVYAARAKKARDWREYFQAIASVDAEKRLTQLATGDVDESLKHWAQLRLGQDRLREGLQAMLQDRRSGLERLKQATDFFSGIKDSSDADVRQLALYGLAQAHEAMGELDSAEREYKLLAETWRDGPYFDIASTQAKELSTKTSQEFYSWLKRYVPPAAASRTPGATGLRPSFDEGSNGPSTLQSPIGQDPFNVGGSFNPSTDLSTTPPDKSTDTAPGSDASGSATPGSSPTDEKKAEPGPSTKPEAGDAAPATGPVLPAAPATSPAPAKGTSPGK